MGRSAKVHKRVKKTKSSASASASAPKPPLPAPHTNTTTILTPSSAQQAPSTKRRSKLKDKASKSHRGKETKGGHVLGGADYVELMMGSRRRAREEAAKLPPPS